MKRFLNTLFINTQKSYLSKEHESIIIRLPDGKKTRIPFITLESIVCFGNIRASTFLLGACADKNIKVSFLTEWGKFLWKVEGKVHGNVLLRKEQYRLSDDECRSCQIAINFLIGKLNNTRSVLERFSREHPDIKKNKIKDISNNIIDTVKNINKINDLETLRGIEGKIANSYFSIFNDMIISQKEDFKFSGRNRRPPLDRVNSILSFTYTILYHDICSVLETVGLDPAVGFLHRDRPGRMSLALDLLEELRPFFADRVTLSLINRKEINKKDFETQDNGAVLLNSSGRKKVLKVYQEKKRTGIMHPFINEKMYIGILFHTQAMLLARFIRGDIEEYPPFLWR